LSFLQAFEIHRRIFQSTAEFFEGSFNSPRGDNAPAERPKVVSLKKKEKAR
jgi:hypothetical protein